MSKPTARDIEIATKAIDIFRENRMLSCEEHNSLTDVAQALVEALAERESEVRASLPESVVEALDFAATPHAGLSRRNAEIALADLKKWQAGE